VNDVPTSAVADASGNDAQAEVQKRHGRLKTLVSDGSLVYAGSFLAVGMFAFKNAIDRIWKAFYDDQREHKAYSIMVDDKAPWKDYGPRGIRNHHKSLVEGLEHSNKHGSEIYNDILAFDEAAYQHRKTLKHDVSKVVRDKAEWFGDLDRPLNAKERLTLLQNIEQEYRQGIDTINTSKGISNNMIRGTWDRFQRARKGYMGKTVAFQAVAATGIITAGLAVLKQNLSLRKALVDMARETSQATVRETRALAINDNYQSANDNAPKAEITAAEYQGIAREKDVQRGL